MIRKRYRQDEDLFNFWPAFTDGMAGLFLTFIMVFITFAVQNYLNVLRLIELEDLVNKIQYEIYQQFSQKEYQNGAFVIGEAVLFDLDSAELRPEGKPRLRQIGSRLKRVLDRLGGAEAKTRLQITIEGHTDITGTVEHNLELSAARAAAVADFWEKSCGMTRKHYEVMAVGRGPYHLLAGLAPDHPNHRRIEIRVYPRYDAITEVLINRRSRLFK